MRYFVEVSYKGTKYSGFQAQLNSNTIQGEIQNALSKVLRLPISLTGSSRTDAGVHALQNFFHFDFVGAIKDQIIYNVNAILPFDIVVQNIFPVVENAHCRFLAISRQYKYYITSVKNPFSTDTAWYYPYKLDIDLLNKAASVLTNYTDFTSFAKRNSEVATHNCTIFKSQWRIEENSFNYTVQANRFLRGMVRALVGTMLLVGRKKLTIQHFEEIILSRDCTKASFATPAHGLFLVQVEFPPMSTKDII